MTEKPNNSILSLSEIHPEGAGPRMGLGGWGLPGINSSQGANASAGPILGYCLEKIATQFAALRDLSIESRSLMQNIRIPQGQPLGMGAKSSGPSRKEKEALQAKETIEQTITLENTQLNDILSLVEKLPDLPFNDKKNLLSSLPSIETNKLLISNVILSILRMAQDKTEFEALLDAAGGKTIMDHLSHDIHYGTLQCLLENYEQIPWNPPLHHPLFKATHNPTESSSDEDVSTSLEGFQAQFDSHSPDLMRSEYVTRFMLGDITAADLVGLTREELYMIAQRGYDMLQEGKLKLTQFVFDGLVYLSPFDPYFYTVLGSLRQRLEDNAGAIACYSQAIQLQPWSISALANRGEIYFNQGKFTEAMFDFQQVIEFDPEDKNPSTLRVKTLVLALNEALKQLN